MRETQNFFCELRITLLFQDQDVQTLHLKYGYALLLILILFSSALFVLVAVVYDDGSEKAEYAMEELKEQQE